MIAAWGLARMVARTATRLGAGALLCVLLAVRPGLAVGQQSHLLVITGSTGEPKYGQLFHEWAAKLIVGATTKHGVPAANITYLTEDPAIGGSKSARSSKENVEKAFTELAARSSAGDVVVVVLIGHGSVQSGQARFNLPGPDLTAVDYQKLLSQLPDRKIGFVNTASASGAFVSSLSALGRTVVTATRSGNEGNETIFAKFFAEAYSGDGSDADKDGKVSLLEAYNFAAREVERWYGEQNRLMTEHAQLEDDGDSKGASKPDGRTGDGLFARSLVLGGVPVAVTTNPELKALYDAKRSTEEKINTLRGMKPRMEVAVYDRELEKLLIELAETNQKIKQLEAKK